MTSNTRNEPKSGQPPAPARPKVLLICPKFFNYQELITGAISNLGFETIWWTDRPSQSAVYKTVLRLFAGPVAALSARSFQKRAQLIEPDSLAHVLVVKGEALSPPVVAALRDRFPSARFSLYLWDAVQNARNGARIAPLFDAVSTFDTHDGELQGWEYRPLFSLLSAAPAAPLQIAYDWSFIGTIHSDRADVLERVGAAIGSSGKEFIFGYFSSRLTYWLQWLRSAAVRRAPAGQFSLTPLPAAQAEQVVQSSRAIVDIEHPRQSGLTTRCFDAVLAGRKLITTNRFIEQSSLYHPSRVCVVDRHNPVIPQSFLHDPVVPLPDATRYAFSSDSWIRHVLGLQQKTDL